MLGAWLVRHAPLARGPAMSLERSHQGLFLLWLAFMGLLLFAAVLLWQRGLWYQLVQADPTGLTIVIVLLFTGASLWVGHRAWRLGQQQARLDQWLGQHTPPHAPAQPERYWTDEYLNGCAPAGTDPSVSLQILSERAHGPHEMAWWLNGIQLKLGLLGKVIGFSILALQLGQMDSFDPSQSARLLKNLTGGLGIALLTTMTGLAGNILLGLQLMRLDRFADALMADTLSASLRLKATPDPEGLHGHRSPGA
jgi:hypothetical protein